MRQGFTLVELSIVLVIIGLLIGGVLAAQSLIQSARATSGVQMLGQLDAALSNYRQNFRQTPGDSDIGAPTGNNNEVYDGSGCNGTYSADERQQYFAQLSTIGMLKGNYVAYQPTSGCAGPHGSWNDMAGITAPFTKVGSKKYALSVSNLSPNVSVYKTYYEMTLPPLDAIIYEKKIGLGSADATMDVSIETQSNPGIYYSYGQGVCHGEFTPVACTDSSAVVALLYYLLPN